MDSMQDTMAEGCTRHAIAPFDNPEADLILRSSDHVEFRVWRCIMREASPIFKDMLSLPQSDNDPPLATPPVVDMTEDSTTLRSLLQFCYPIKPPSLSALDQITNVLEAAHKYSIDPLKEFAQEALEHHINQQPLRVYALACRYRVENIARGAAKCTLGTKLDTEYCSELEEISGGDVLRLITYREKCSDAVATILLTAVPMPWLKRYESAIFYKCSNEKCARGVKYTIFDYQGKVQGPRSWFSSYLDGLANQLRLKPTRETVIARDIGTPLGQAAKCHFCRTRAYTDLLQFRDSLADEIDKRVSEVRFEFRKI